MCLSDVYRVSADDQVEPIASKVSNITSEKGIVKMIDIFGDETELQGTIEDVDLLENKIYIRTED